MPDISTTDNGTHKKTGAWLPWSVVEPLLRLRLRPCSRWQVYLAALLTSARYGGRDAKLGIDDICRITGLAPRTVKGAISDLQKSGLIVREGRARRLSVPLLHDNTITADCATPFTKKQDLAITSILSKISELRGIDGGTLIVPDEYAVRLGLSSSVSYTLAYEILKLTGTRALAGIFVEALVALYNSDQIQGRELR